MGKRTLQELNLMDDFLFNAMVTNPEVGEEFARELLKTIFRREFGRLVIVPQKVYYGSDTEYHGARLDVYLEETDSDISDAMIYDVEPDHDSRLESVAALPRRVRFYHSKIDGKSLKSGENYKALKNVIIIMITNYDPFDLKRCVYTIRNQCVEEPQMPYDDGARTIFLYTKGTEGNPPEELRHLMRYLEDTTQQNACTNGLKKIHQMVESVRQDEEVSLEYMKIFEREEMLKEIGKAEGEYRKLIQLVIKKVRKNQTCGAIAEALEENEITIAAIMDAVQKYSPDYDEDAIYAELAEQDHSK